MTSEMRTQWNSSWLDSGNQSYLDSQYEDYLKDPQSVPEDWRNYFSQLPTNAQNTQDVSHADIKALFKQIGYQAKRIPIQNNTSNHEYQQNAASKIIFSYRLLGHLYSKINPLSNAEPAKVPNLELDHYNLQPYDLDISVDVGDLAGNGARTIRQIISDLKTIYCGSVATEYMHIDDTTERLWVRNKIENAMLQLNLNKDEKIRILEQLIATDGLEKYLGAKYPGAKRFSLEGCDSLIVGLEKIILASGTKGIEEIVIAMAHRGRLNVLVNLLGKKPRDLFDQFEDKHDLQVENGDVKYHQGFASDLLTEGGKIHVSLAFNPSHLEIVTPVATGSVRARQERRKDDQREKVICIAIHGDAAFSGQGVVMETLNMSQTRGYSVGGTVHIIVNNQIGFTTSNPKDARSTLYCSDIGKMMSIPIFHVNADDPEAIYIVANIALEYRQKFHKDVIIDLLGYRRMGHNEADEPSATQPVMYKNIRSHPIVKQIYADKLITQGICTAADVETMVQNYRTALDKRDEIVTKHVAEHDQNRDYASDWTPYSSQDWRTPTVTKVPLDTLQKLARIRDKIPEGFVLNPRVQKIVEDREKMTRGELPIDWGYAETLAYATLLNEDFDVRLSGQDSGRGTFFHRHSVWHEYNTGETHISLCNVNPEKNSFWVIDSLLSEAGVLAFEYGFSSSEPRTLTLWEAQFGDFANGAQVVIDQFISSAEQKWGRLSGLVMLLPHGYEGQGPEHSSARIERYLNLCAQRNLQVCIPSTPAQMFHMLRRQMLRPMRKPLITITPKSLLRHKAAISTLDDLANGEFKVIIAPEIANHDIVTKVILCAGKIYYEIEEQRQEQNLANIAILRIEQLYPFPQEELQAELKKYSNAKQIVWCQEEPQNQGAWYSTQHNLLECLQPNQTLSYAGRKASAAPAVGYFSLHEEQQHALVVEALQE